MDTADLYSDTRLRLLQLAAGLAGEGAATPVPALPTWSVKDAYAHLCGLCADILDGRMDGAGSPAWTAKQVGDRAELSLPDVCAEWAERGPRLDEWLRATGEQRTTFVAFDVWNHEQDIRGALGLNGDRDDDRVEYLAGHALTVFGRRFAENGAPALRVAAGSVERVLGEGDPDATLRVSEYELLRILFGRRSLGQIERAGWDGEPSPYVEHLHLFDLPTGDLVD